MNETETRKHKTFLVIHTSIFRMIFLNYSISWFLPFSPSTSLHMSFRMRSSLMLFFWLTRFATYSLEVVSFLFIPMISHGISSIKGHYITFLKYHDKIDQWQI